jgi:hypothetical protein
MYHIFISLLQVNWTLWREINGSKYGCLYKMFCWANGIEFCYCSQTVGYVGIKVFFWGGGGINVNFDWFMKEFCFVSYVLWPFPFWVVINQKEIRQFSANCFLRLIFICQVTQKRVTRDWKEVYIYLHKTQRFKTSFRSIPSLSLNTHVSFFLRFTLFRSLLSVSNKSCQKFHS